LATERKINESRDVERGHEWTFIRYPCLFIGEKRREHSFYPWCSLVSILFIAVLVGTDVTLLLPTDNSSLIIREVPALGIATSNVPVLF
jgi:hypothetical protein